MSQFQIHDVATAPEGSRDLLRELEQQYGFLPNLYRIFAEAPIALHAYTAVNQLFLEKASALGPVEQQVVLLSVARENTCEYCMAVHTVTAGMQDVPKEVVQAIRDGETLPDTKLEALRRFAQAVVRERGWVAPRELDGFLEAGYDRAAVLEVIVGVMLKTLSNYVNHIAAPPLDDAFAKAKWEAPERLSGSK